MTPDEAPRASEPTQGRDKLEGYFRFAAFAVLALVGAVATFRAYIALESAILTWMRPQWVPLAQAAFSIVVLALVVWLMRAWIIGKRS